MACRLVLIVFLAAASFHGANSASWGYGNSGGSEITPGNWGNSYPNCNSFRQSPINIDTTKTRNQDLGCLFFRHYYRAIASIGMENNGHGVTFTIQLKKDQYTPEIRGKSLGNKVYKLASFHFHWGGDDSEGSEHTVDDKQFPLELHLVHYNADYGSLAAAVEETDGLAVLGILFEVDDSAKTKSVKFLDKIKDSFANVINEGETTTILNTDLCLHDLLPSFATTKYYRYTGSLTTPTCNEVVTWTVFRNKVKITSAQLARFRSIMYTNADGGTASLTKNFRPVQKLRGRKVICSTAFGCEIWNPFQRWVG